VLRLIDFFFVIAVLVNLVKGAELLLRPYQEDWLKAKLEELTLWLDYTRPIKWYMARPGVAYLLSRSLLFFTSSFFLLRRINYWGHGTFFIVMQSLNLTLLLEMIRVTHVRRSAKTSFQIESEYREGKLTAWLWRAPTILNSLLRQMVLAIAGLFIVVGTIALIPLLLVVWISANRWSLSLSIHLLIFTMVLLGIVYRKQIFRVALPLGNVGSFAAFNVLLTTLIITAEAALKLLRAFLWRVVEYNKGPVAAFTLVITVLLGIAEAYFRFIVHT
jgi:hypothetical protein